MGVDAVITLVTTFRTDFERQGYCISTIVLDSQSFIALSGQTNGVCDIVISLKSYNNFDLDAEDFWTDISFWFTTICGTLDISYVTSISIDCYPDAKIRNTLELIYLLLTSL
jgi:hypothetical protein